MTLDTQTPAKEAFGSQKYTFKSPNLRRYDWMFRVNLSVFCRSTTSLVGKDRRDPGEFSKKKRRHPARATQRVGRTRRNQKMRLVTRRIRMGVPKSIPGHRWLRGEVVAGGMAFVAFVARSPWPWYFLFKVDSNFEVLNT